MKKIFFLLLLVFIGQLPVMAQFITTPTTRAQLRYNATQLQGAILQTQQKAAIYADSVLYNGGGGGWSLAGNAGTSPATNFLGTTDTATLVFKVGGVQAGWIDAGKYENTFYGLYSGDEGTASEYGGNVAFGFGTLALNTMGYDLTALGTYALLYNTTGISNSANGYDALGANTSGSYNTATGASALQYNNIGNDNTATGNYALYQNISGSNNTSEGYNSLWVNATGSSNTSVGVYSLLSSNASWNTAIGDSALYNNTMGFSNVAVGYAAGVGYSSGYGYGNTALGDSAYLQTNGNQNTCIGYHASCGTHQSNSTAIGAGALAGNDNQVVIGNTSVGSFVFNGDLEPGLNNPGSSGQVLTSQGGGVSPQWQTPDGTRLLFSGIINLNPPTDSLITTPVSGTFQVGDEITGSLSGTTAQVYRISGGNLYLIDVAYSGGFEMGDIITGSISGAIDTVMSDAVYRQDTVLSLSYPGNHRITYAVFDSVNVPFLQFTNDIEIWSLPNRFGWEALGIHNPGLYGSPIMSDTNNNYLSNSGFSYNYNSLTESFGGNSAPPWLSLFISPIPQNFYLTIGNAEGTSATAHLKIYGN